MCDTPKPNNCNIVFECDDPKECVHYKKKEVSNPCHACESYKHGKRWPYAEHCHACFAYENYIENKDHCYHSGVDGKLCLHAIAQAQAMSVYSKQIGLEGFSTRKREVNK